LNKSTSGTSVSNGQVSEQGVSAVRTEDNVWGHEYVAQNPAGKPAHTLFVHFFLEASYSILYETLYTPLQCVFI
jgi:hypothetical protein